MCVRVCVLTWLFPNLEPPSRWTDLVASNVRLKRIHTCAGGAPIRQAPAAVDMLLCFMSVSVITDLSRSVLRISQVSCVHTPPSTHAHFIFVC